MTAAKKPFSPKRQKFAGDPLGYCASAWPQWALVQERAGGPPANPFGPTSADLSAPVLWLSHARALSTAAQALLGEEPEFEMMPTEIKAICDAQYCAVALMLIGYGLETSLKGMLILKKQFDPGAKSGSKYRHHRLEELADFVPGLDEKDKAMLRSLRRYVEWAGRYPAPHPGREDEVPQIFGESERFQISGRDLINLAERVMGHARKVVDETL